MRHGPAAVELLSSQQGRYPSGTRPSGPLLDYLRDWFLVGGSEPCDGRKLPAVTEAVTFSRPRKIPGWKGQAEDIRWRRRPPHFLTLAVTWQKTTTSKESPFCVFVAVSGNVLAARLAPGCARPSCTGLAAGPNADHPPSEDCGRSGCAMHQAVTNPTRSGRRGRRAQPQGTTTMNGTSKRLPAALTCTLPSSVSPGRKDAPAAACTVQRRR